MYLYTQYVDCELVDYFAHLLLVFILLLLTSPPPLYLFIQRGISVVSMFIQRNRNGTRRKNGKRKEKR